MKTKEIIGKIIAGIGLFAAISVVDGSQYEILIRISGVIMIAIGAWMSELFNIKNKQL